jgi:hypothetical protein
MMNDLRRADYWYIMRGYWYCRISFAFSLLVLLNSKAIANCETPSAQVVTCFLYMHFKCSILFQSYTCITIITKILPHQFQLCTMFDHSSSLTETEVHS